jgi:hypothetical protein
MAAKRKYPPGTKRVSFFIPPALKSALADAASRTNRTETEVLHAGLRREIRNVSESCDAAEQPKPQKAFG